MKHERSYEPYGFSSKTPESETAEHAPNQKKHHQTDDNERHASQDKKHHTKKDKDKKKDSKDPEDKKAQHHKQKKVADKKTKAAVAAPEETPEIKQERRSEIVERSLQLRKLYEETPVPRDPQVLARLMVADHILTLNQRIEEPADPKTVVNKEHLLQALDSMGELAEKLEHPESESTPDIQEAYEAVVQLAEDTLANKESLDTAMEENVAAARVFAAKNDKLPNKQNKDSIEADSPYSAAALIGFILRRRSQKAHSTNPPSASQAAPPVNAELSGNDVGSGTPVATVPHHIPPPSLHQPESHLPHSLSPAEARAAYRESTRAEHRMPVRLRASNRIASLAVISTLAAHSAPPPRETNNVHAKLSPITNAQETPAVQHADVLQSPARTADFTPAAISTPMARPFEESTAATATINHDSQPVKTDNRKIEHLKLQELLSMAETVPVGHGERLRKIYERGLIDKDGLIKILKSRSKNNDYIREYREQVTRRKNLIESSPEFLTSASPHDDSPVSAPDNAASSDRSSEQVPQEPKILPFLPDDLKKALSSTPTPPPTTGFNNPAPAQTPWLPIIGISLLVIAAGVLIYFLLLG